MEEMDLRQLSALIGVPYSTCYHWLTRGVQRIGKLKPTRFERRGAKQDRPMFSAAAVARILRNRKAGLRF